MGLLENLRAEREKFNSQILEFYGFARGVLLALIFLYFVPIIVLYLTGKLDFPTIALLTAIYLMILTGILIYSIPKKVITSTLLGGKILQYHEELANKETSCKIKLNYRSMLLLVIALGVYFLKIYSFIAIPSILNYWMTPLFYLIITLLVIDIILPPIANEFKNTCSKFFIRQKRRAILHTMILYIAIYLTMTASLIKLSIHNSSELSVTLIITLIIVPLFTYVILNDIILAWYYLDYRKIGKVILFPAFIAIITAVSSIYFASLFLSHVYSSDSLLLDFFYLLRKTISLILSSILMLVYLQKKTQGALRLPSTRKREKVSVIDTVLAFVNDLIRKLILYNFASTAIVIIPELARIDITGLILSFFASTIAKNGNPIISPMIDIGIIMYFSIIIFIIFLAIICAIFRILRYLQMLVDLIDLSK
ncbi:MAG: hypothetical protein ACP6IQ_10285 [Candidatus Njordarchaeia archaeon]|nr:hypothetical protein [Candidatus Korarchaeota archaeon]